MPVLRVCVLMAVSDAMHVFVSGVMSVCVEVLFTYKLNDCSQLYRVSVAATINITVEVCVFP